MLMETICTPKTFVASTIKCVNAKLPVMVTGSPGVGKTQLVKRVAKLTDHRLIIAHPVVDSPIDYKGFAVANRNENGIAFEAKFLPFNQLEQLINADVPTIYFVDDLGQASAMVQSALMQLFLAREINGHKISDQVVFIAATNRRQDKANVTGILEPVKSRFACIVELTVSYPDWREWAIQNNIHPAVVAYLRYKPEELNKFLATTDLTNSPIPRTWEFVSMLLQAGIDSFVFIAGAIGVEAATGFVAFLQCYEKLISIESILANPETADIPDVNDLSANHAVGMMVVYNTTRKNCKNAMKYIQRLPEEIMATCLYSMEIKCPDVTSVREFAVAMSKMSSMFSY